MIIVYPVLIVSGKNVLHQDLSSVCLKDLRTYKQIELVRICNPKKVLLELSSNLQNFKNALQKTLNKKSKFLVIHKKELSNSFARKWGVVTRNGFWFRNTTKNNPR